jgi:hypothetical protein
MLFFLDDIMKESAMLFRGYLHFKAIFVIFVLSFGSHLCAGSGLTVLSLPEDPVNGWYAASPGGLSNAVSQPVFLPDGPASWHGMHGFWMFDTPYSRVIGGNRKLFGGASFLKTDGIEIRTDVAQEEPIGETGYYNGTLFAGREWIISQDLRMGTTAQLVFERLYHASALGGALNLAVAWRVHEFSILTAGVCNLGKMQDLYKSETPMPLNVYTGFSAGIKGLQTNLSLHLDEEAEIYGTGLIRYDMKGIFSAGLSYSGLNNSWHLGGSLHYKQFRFGAGQFFMQDQIAYPMVLSIAYIPVEH